MSSPEKIYVREGQFVKKDGDVEFNFRTYDGIGLPQFAPTRLPGGYQKRINDIINLETRPNDVLLATYPKCGTNWGYEILNMLLQGNSNYTGDTKISTMLEAIGDLSTIDGAQSPRILNTHLPYKWFPCKMQEQGGKIIHITRNPKDAYVSYYYQMLSLLEMGPKTKDMTWAQYFDTSVMGKGSLYGTWFDYEKEMHQAKTTSKNILTVHFEHLKEEPEKEIRAIATFLNLETPDDFIKDIAHKCQFQNLKKAKDEAIKIKRAFPDVQRYIAERQTIFPGFKPPDLFRKGIVGDWKNHFTVAQNEQFDALYEKEMRDTKIEVIYKI